MPDQDGRPDPLGEAVNSASPLPAAAGALITALLGAGLISTYGVTLITVVLASGATLVTAGSAYLTARRVASAARAAVTPTDDPRNDAGDELVPRTEQLLSEVLEQLAERLAPSSPGPELVAPPTREPSRLASAPGRGYGDVYHDELWPEPDPDAGHDPASTRLPPPRRRPEASGRHRTAAEDRHGPG